MKETGAALIHTNSVELDGSEEREAAWVRSVIQAVRGTRYGSVEVVIHEGRVVQIERREKVRFEEASRRPPDHRGRENPNHDRADRTAGRFEKDEETTR
jgi:hypothetical protein